MRKATWPEAPAHAPAFWQSPATTSEPGTLGVTLDTALIDQLRAVLRGAPTTESELRQLWQSADGWARALQGQIAGSERRLRMLARGPSPPLAKIAPELQRIETLRPQLAEMTRLLSDLERRARELRAGWLIDSNQARDPRAQA